MNTLNLQGAKVTKSTSKKIQDNLYSNRGQMSGELVMFYADVKGLLDIQLCKPALHRLTMQQILERAYNIDAYILNSGAAEVTTEFLSV